MRPNQSWMLRRNDHFGLVIEELKNGIDGFIQVATRDPTIVDVSVYVPSVGTVLGRSHFVFLV